MRSRLVEWVCLHAQWLVFVGLASALVGYRLAGWMAIFLGICGACFQGWRYEPGLWMLSGLFLPITLLGFVPLAANSASTIASGLVPSASDCDLWGATVFLAAQVLFLAIVTRTNWSIKKKPEIPEL